MHLKCGALLGLTLLLAPVLHAQTTANIAGTYSGTETATLTLTAAGQKDTTTFSGTNDNVVITQVGNTFSFTITDATSGVSVDRTGRISGNSITSMTGPALGFKPTAGLVVTENKITSGTGTIYADRIEMHVVGYAKGSLDGVAGQFDVVSDVVFRPKLPPSITVQPGAVSVVAPNSAAFAVTATGAAPLSYLWQRLPAGSATWADVPVGGTVYSGANLYRLSVVTTTGAMSSDRFRCRVSNAIGTVTSSEAALTVTLPAAPVITTQPVDVVIAAGRQALFAAQASGSPTWQWHRRPAGSTIWTAMSEGGSYTGTRTGTLQVYIASVAVSGDAFRVVATNAGGTVTSDIATLTVEPGLTFTTFAGTAGEGGNIDGTGSAARLLNPTGMVFDANGTLILADRNNHTIRKITPAGVVTTWIGTSAGLFRPCGLALDGNGTLFLADQANHVIRKIAPDAAITVFAGTIGAVGTADGTGSAARFNQPHGLVFDADGNLFVADQGNSTIRRITPAGVVTTFAGGPGIPGMADGTGPAARFNSAANLTFDDAGHLYVADQGNSRICRITPAGVVTTIAGGAGTGSTDGIGTAALFNQIAGIVWDPRGWLYITDRVNQTVRRVSLDGRVVTLAGLAGQAGSSDGTGAAARFNNPFTIVVDAAGAVYVCDGMNNTIRKGAWSTATSALPAITRQPVAASATAGGATSLSVQVPGADGVHYRWLCDGATVQGATDATLDLRSAQLFQAGNYRAVVTLADGRSIVSDLARVTVHAAPASDARLMNLSTRALCQTGDNILIPGFVVTGTGTKRMLIRAVGPTLGDFGVGGTLADPQITVYRNGEFYASNDDWGGGAPIITAASTVGAFPLPPGSADAALLLDLPFGSYTAMTSGKNAGTGVAIVEVYDVDDGITTTRLLNISNRGFVGTGDSIMIPGFVVSNEGSRTFLVRAVGPTLAGFGVGGTLADPQLTVFSGNTPILANDNWDGIAGSSTTSSVAALVGAFPLTAGSKDAAFVVTLPPGVYTVQASGVGATTGVALVEVYLVP